MKVIVLEACDGFSLILQKGNGEAESRYWFNQEDIKEGLVDVFKELGFESEYGEDY